MIGDKKCLRYIVPFSYKESFDELCDRIDKEGLWERISIQENGKMDIYSHIQAEFVDDGKSSLTVRNKMGISWKCVSKTSLFKFTFFKEKLKKYIYT